MRNLNVNSKTEGASLTSTRSMFELPEAYRNERKYGGADYGEKSNLGGVSLPNILGATPKQLGSGRGSLKPTLGSELLKATAWGRRALQQPEPISRGSEFKKMEVQVPLKDKVDDSKQFVVNTRGCILQPITPKEKQIYTPVKIKKRGKSKKKGAKSKAAHTPPGEENANINTAKPLKMANDIGYLKAIGVKPSKQNKLKGLKKKHPVFFKNERKVAVDKKKKLDTVAGPANSSKSIRKQTLVIAKVGKHMKKDKKEEKKELKKRMGKSGDTVITLKKKGKEADAGTYYQLEVDNRAEKAKNAFHEKLLTEKNAKQRQQIYALNKLMTDLEKEAFLKFSKTKNTAAAKVFGGV
eukprot:Nk52_evm3s1967 gene=Nk52_evmTU3s1967